jgi:hypothetical protein
MNHETTTTDDTPPEGRITGGLFDAFGQLSILPSKFAKVRLADLTHLEIRTFLRELEEKKTSFGKPLQANTINKILARLRTMTNDAFESGEIASPRIRWAS